MVHVPLAPIAEAGSQKNLGNSIWVSHVWGRDQTTGVITTPPRVCISEKLKSALESGLELRHSDLGCGHLKEYLKHQMPIPST